ncbi:MAG: lytic transglycosylase domain-containing protein [Gammaproteobacteria bacterium]
MSNLPGLRRPLARLPAALVSRLAAIHLAAPRLAVALVVGLAANTAFAGAQQYEPLSDAVRGALAAAVRDDGPAEPRFESVLEKVDWLSAMSVHLPRRWKPEYRQRVEFLSTLRYEAQRAGLDPHLVLGLVEVESGFRRHAISVAGARGYMQVMPFWTGVIGDGDATRLFDMRTNLRYGCTILRHYLDIERGNLFRALGRYNGSLGRPEYPNVVLRAWKRWEARAGNREMTAAAEPGAAPRRAPGGAAGAPDTSGIAQGVAPREAPGPIASAGARAARR